MGPERARHPVPLEDRRRLVTTSVNPPVLAAPLAPVHATLRAMSGGNPLPGLAPDLIVDDERGWTPATRLIDGAAIDEFLGAAARRWQASPHAAAALAWKSYAYWLALPAVLGWAAARRVPLLDPADVLLDFDGDAPVVTVGLRPSTGVAVLPNDPLAFSGLPQVRVVADEAALLRALRVSLLDRHLTPLVATTRARVRLGARTLLGSLASGIAYGLLDAADVLPGPTRQHIDTLLGALDVADLVELVPGPTGELTVRRKTCCLAFTLPTPKICPGCCLRA